MTLVALWRRGFRLKGQIRAEREQDSRETEQRSCSHGSRWRWRASNDRDRRSPQIGGVGKDQGRFRRAVLTPSGATADLLNVASHLAGVLAIESPPSALAAPPCPLRPLRLVRRTLRRRCQVRPPGSGPPIATQPLPSPPAWLGPAEFAASKQEAGLLSYGPQHRSAEFPEQLIGTAQFPRNHDQDFWWNR